MVKFSTAIVLLFWLTIVNGLAQDRYAVHYKYKPNGVFSESLLSEKSITRRSRDNVLLDSTDLPVATKYIEAIRPYVNRFIYHSKWLNASIIQASEEAIKDISSLDFVNEVNLVAKGEGGTLERSTKNYKAKKKKKGNSSATAPSDFEFQNSILGISAMHEAGFTGEGVLVAIFDAGFLNVDKIPAFDHLFAEQKIYATKDFVVPDSDNVYRADTHGTGTLSLMAAYDPENLIAGAYGASYILCITEDVDSEYRIEEYNWVKAAEYADSLGVDMINSSLGYNYFDDEGMNYSKEDLDGQTAIITKGANMAAEKGILVVSSAGNEGNISWKTITVPSDAKNILSVGAINSNLNKAGFSSIGPSADNRIKPELVAYGSGVTLWRQEEGTSSSSGTSFSAPQVAALAAGLREANPNWTNDKLREQILLSGSQFSQPDNELGYGVPDFTRAMFGKLIEDGEPEGESTTRVYPNPLTKDELLIEFGTSINCTMKLFASDGKLVSELELERSKSNFPYSASMEVLNPGIYLVELQDDSSVSTVKLWKK
ncbi:S8 family serine peptidase [Cyclobacterium marinum]|uniref:S8 family serine peptidase n=1 Tax=Cyclobacterium marinum TaxID=104 RepID=UPI0011EC39D2|nr:S8 family serine peptidase [Cyclobacterium marinum]MBI0397728.1 S8 family serine peptidase [Cyclobacterium marinum]